MHVHNPYVKGKWVRGCILLSNNNLFLSKNSIYLNTGGRCYAATTTNPFRTFTCEIH